MDCALTELIKFMDDIYLFSNDRDVIANDFQVIQRLLGDKGLSVNPQKTRRDAAAHFNIDREIDDIKKTLLDRRRILVTTGYDESGEDIVKEFLYKQPLSESELDYIDSLLKTGLK